MLKFILLLNLIELSLSDFLNYCDFITDKESCIEMVYCAWCNVTTPFNDTYSTNESCIFKNTCSNLFNDTNCVSNINKYQICNFTISAINLLLLFVYAAITYTLIYSIKNFYNNEVNPRYNCLIDILITCCVFIPSFILWFNNSSYYLPFILALLTVTFITFITSKTCSYRQRRHLTYNGYHQINT